MKKQSSSTNAKRKLLVVDDEGDLSDLLEIAFRDDCILRTAFDGKSALGLLSEFQPDLILIDGYMATQSDLDLIQELKKQAKTSIILVSTGSGLAKLSESQKKEIASVLVKPFSLKELRQQVFAIFASSSSS